MLRFFVFLHKISGYNAILISTIVDYFPEFQHLGEGYNAILISTIVDECVKCIFFREAIMLF